jgi:hypothetical protein
MKGPSTCPRLLGTLFLLSSACGANSPRLGGDWGAAGGAVSIVGSGGGGGVTAGLGGGGGAAGATILGLDAGDGSAPPDADTALPSGFSAPSPPEVACDGQADAAVACDLPPSTCALFTACDASALSCGPQSIWMVYYQNPRCVDGRCVWDEGYFQCEGFTSCVQGACQGRATLP